MLKIKWQGNFYEVPEDELSLYPGYEMASDEEFNNVGKLNDPVQENTAIAGSVNTSSMDFTSDPGSLVLPKIPKPIGSELDNLTIDDVKKQDQQKKQKEDFKKNNKKELDVSDLIDENGNIKLSRKTIYALG